MVTWNFVEQTVGMLFEVQKLHWNLLSMRLTNNSPLQPSWSPVWPPTAPCSPRPIHPAVLQVTNAKWPRADTSSSPKRASYLYITEIQGTSRTPPYIQASTDYQRRLNYNSHSRPAKRTLLSTKCTLDMISMWRHHLYEDRLDELEARDLWTSRRIQKIMVSGWHHLKLVSHFSKHQDVLSSSELLWKLHQDIHTKSTKSLIQISTFSYYARAIQRNNRGRQRPMISSDLRVRRSLISFISYTRDRIRDIRIDDASDIHITSFNSYSTLVHIISYSSSGRTISTLPHQTYSDSYHLYCYSDVTKVDVRIWTSS